MILSSAVKKVILASVVAVGSVCIAVASQWYVVTLHHRLVEAEQAIADYQQQKTELATIMTAAERAKVEVAPVMAATLATHEVVTFISELETKLRKLGVKVETESIKNNEEAEPPLIAFSMTLEGEWSAVERAIDHKFLKQYAYRTEEIDLLVSSESVVYQFEFSVLQSVYDF